MDETTITTTKIHFQKYWSHTIVATKIVPSFLFLSADLWQFPWKRTAPKIKRLGRKRWWALLPKMNEDQEKSKVANLFPQDSLSLKNFSIWWLHLVTFLVSKYIQRMVVCLPVCLSVWQEFRANSFISRLTSNHLGFNVNFWTDRLSNFSYVCSSGKMRPDRSQKL